MKTYGNTAAESEIKQNMSGKNIKQIVFLVKACGFLLIICLMLIANRIIVYAEGETLSITVEDRRLKNGSFEDEQAWTDSYKQMNQSVVPSWNTTAFQGKIELFRKNAGTYIKNVTLSPTDGDYAAELNADEESTLYQNVKTMPSSIYQWGLDHGGRNGTDTMALVIGPKQSIDPSKPSKDGRDQLMQMVDWLIAQGKTSVKTSQGMGEHLILYSKKFAEDGTFVDNAGNNAFSSIPSTIYTEEWHVWIMSSSKATTETENPWNSYGSNAEGSAGGTNSSGNTAVDLSKYYLYTVPAGQTETLFGFVSVGYVESITTPENAKTYGNFLDNINFQIYHPLSGSTTNHGSAVVGGSDGTSSGEGASGGHIVTVDGKLATYVTDGEKLKVQAIIEREDVDDGCEFVGVYYTIQDENGDPVTNFLQLAGKDIEDTGDLTDEQKKDKWIRSINDDGDTVYTHYLDDITSATDLHFVFIKSPTITYDPNGGKEYIVDRIYNTDEAANVYNFKPASGQEEAQAGTGTIFIDPYVSHAAEGQNEGWKFMGWLLTGDTVNDVSADQQINADQLGHMILPAEHTIACDYAFDGFNGDSKAQYFKIYNGVVSLSKTINSTEPSKDIGVIWTDNGEPIEYANIHKGLTLVAQWRWLQAFIPQVRSGNTYTDSVNGGTVEINGKDESDTNYNPAYNEKGGKSYYAATDETITATATAKDGFTFEGWYDADGNLVSTNATYSYAERKERVNTYYARFSGNVTQTYIRQINNGTSWEDTTNDKIGILGRYDYTDAVGMPISSTAAAGDGYIFVGWYDSEGNKVADDMLINDGSTINYITVGDATYYARFESAPITASVAKVWSDNGNSDAIRPSSVGMELYKNDECITTITLPLADGSWTYTENNLKQTDTEGNFYAYTWKEVNTDIVNGDPMTGYEPSYDTETTDGGQITTVTNYHKASTIDKSVRKVWDDSDNKQLIRPDSVKVQLYANDNLTKFRASANGYVYAADHEEDCLDTVILNESNGWNAVIKDLPVANDEGDIVYTWKEVLDDTVWITGESVIGYAPEYTQNADDANETIITNKHLYNAGSSVRVNKKIRKDSLSFAVDTPTFVFILTGRDVYGNDQTFTESVTYTEEDLNSADAQGYIIKSVTFENVPYGTYTATEAGMEGIYKQVTLTPDTANTSVTDEGTAFNVQVGPTLEEAKQAADIAAAGSGE